MISKLYLSLLYGLTGEKRAISITIPSFAGGLSGKLISGDIVSVIAVDYKEKGETVVPEELQYVEVIAVTDSKGNDDETVTVRPDGEEETELPETVTLLVTPMQANILAELEAEGEIHISLVYRGTAENAQKFISAQENLLEELTSENEKEKDTAEGAAQEKELQSEAAEKKYESEKPKIESVVIIPETTEETTAETEETEVTANGESV